MSLLYVTSDVLATDCWLFRYLYNKLALQSTINYIELRQKYKNVFRVIRAYVLLLFVRNSVNKGKNTPLLIQI